MRNTFLVLVMLLSQLSFCQEETKKFNVTIINFTKGQSVDLGKYFKWKSKNDFRNDSIKIFSLSPISRRVKQVNGFALGVGHYENEKIKFQEVNGLNLEVSPLCIALFTFALNVPFEAIFVGINDGSLSNTSFMDDDYKTRIRVNGLNLSSGGFMKGAEMNGFNISVFTGMNKINGISLNGAVIGTEKFNGLCISGIANVSEQGNGAQIAISNVSRNHKGIQIGLFNHSKNLRGMQFGIWNTNGKRKLPFINWQFKK
ncbi:LA_2272 family surface repeat-containing protein [Flavobacterium sp.]|uniref:LA_2272 family surface repeat-containing protein n=1 Tax=Flavobacterium sp. TaxID=239 RepID=UPI003751F22B